MVTKSRGHEITQSRNSILENIHGHRNMTRKLFQRIVHSTVWHGQDLCAPWLSLRRVTSPPLRGKDCLPVSSGAARAVMKLLTRHSHACSDLWRKNLQRKFFNGPRRDVTYWRRRVDAYYPPSVSTAASERAHTNNPNTHPSTLSHTPAYEKISIDQRQRSETKNS